MCIVKICKKATAANDVGTIPFNEAKLRRAMPYNYTSTNTTRKNLLLSLLLSKRRGGATFRLIYLVSTAAVALLTINIGYTHTYFAKSNFGRYI